MPTPRLIPDEYADHLSIDNAARELGVSVRKVWYLINADALDVIRLKGPRTLVTPASLADYQLRQTGARKVKDGLPYVDRNDRSKR